MRRRDFSSLKTAPLRQSFQRIIHDVVILRENSLSFMEVKSSDRKSIHVRRRHEFDEKSRGGNNIEKKENSENLILNEQTFSPYF